MQKRGSAIIIAMLLISAVGTIAFTFSRSLFVEMANANLYENGTVAYYAAESGVEEGLLRFRLDRNSELPYGTNGVPTAQDQIIRSNLSDETVASDLTGGTALKDNDGIDSASQVYDLRISSKDSLIGIPTENDANRSDLSNFVATKDNEQYVIKRDESKKFDLSNILASSDVNLSFKALTSDVTLSSPLNEKKCALLEISLIGTDISGSKTEQKKTVFYSGYPSCNYSSVFSKDQLSKEYIQQYSLDGAGVAQIKNLKSILWPTVLLSESTLVIKPIGSDIAFSIERKNSASDPLIYGPLTKISSTGYYGDAARRLEVSIDRQSGTLYDLFDYVIYKAK